jgi:hypothetical protein
MRMASPLAEVGSLAEDRSAAVFGVLGERPRMIPVRLRLTRAGKDESTFAFDVADDPLLGPLLLYAAVDAVLASTERTEGNVTLRLLEGSTIRTADHPDVDLENVFTGASAPYHATATSAFILYLLMNNDRVPPRIEGVNLLVDYDDTPQSARVRRVTLDRYRAHPGDTVSATIVLSPFRGRDRVLTQELAIPPETEPGTMVLHVGDGFAASRAEAGDAPLVPTELSQLIGLINRVPRNDRVYVVALRDDAGVSLGGARLPNLPPSAATMLTRPRSRGNFALVAQRSVLEQSIPVEFEVEGVARVQIEVEAR